MTDFIILAHKAHTRPVFKLNDLTSGRMDILCRCVNSALFLSHDLRRDVNIHLVLMGDAGSASNSSNISNADNTTDIRVESAGLAEPAESAEPVQSVQSVIVRFSGEKVRYLSPDERSAGSLILKALEKGHYDHEVESTKGVYIRKGDLSLLLHEFRGRNIIYLREDGVDIRRISAGTVTEHDSRCVPTYVSTDIENAISADILTEPVFVLGDHTGVTDQEEALLQKAQAKVISLGPVSLHSDHCIILIHNELDRMHATGLHKVDKTVDGVDTTHDN